MTQDILLAAILSGMVAFIICRLATPLGAVFGILDRPDDTRKLHIDVTPLVGGLAIIIPVALIAIIFASRPVEPIYYVLALACLTALLLGLVDDRAHIRPVVRLFATIMIAWASIYFAPDFELSFLRFGFISQSFFLEGWSAVFSILCLVGLLNAVNMADGKNGLVIGMSLVWCGLLALYLPQHSMALIAGLFVALIIAFSFNIKGRLFLGDSGSYAISILFGLLAIYAYNINFAYVNADAIALWFLVPVVDCVRLMVWRVIQGRSPFSPDRSHLHHYLERALSWRLGLPIYLSFIAAPAILAYFLPGWTGMLTLGTIAVYVMLLMILWHQKPYQETA